jgi:hypothetical protein
MSKEQTPITAEIRKILYDTESIEDAVEPIKELINAKVYYETEVKPKYKL